MQLDFERLRRIRAEQPTAIQALYDARSRRPLGQEQGGLFIVAADHPARGALGVRDRPSAMANRYDLLERIATALSRPGVDGVLGSPDVIDDLNILGVLHDKVVVGSMNRGGLRSAVFELDDRFTGFDVDSMVQKRIDFAKLLLRIDLQDRGSVETLEHAARAVSQAASAQLPIMLEPFMCSRVDGGVVNHLSADSVIQSVAIASAIGNSTAFTWLKLPVVADMERVMEATTLPTLLLGGDPQSQPDEMYAAWERALRLPGVRGLVAGRTILYPQDDDVELAVDTAAALVHGPRTSAPEPLSRALFRRSKK
jgi:DhnA family fructose-bisphosphate aldolase class Ia